MPTAPATTVSAHIYRWARIRRLIALFDEPVTLPRGRSSADFIINSAVCGFWYIRFDWNRDKATAKILREVGSLFAGSSFDSLSPWGEKAHGLLGEMAVVRLAIA